MMAILTEHFAGKWPFWLSPRQALVVPVSKAHAEYASSVQRKLRGAGYYADVDLSSRTLNKMGVSVHAAEMIRTMKAYDGDGTGALDFTRAFSGGEYGSKYYTGRRVWDGFRRFKPSLALPAEYGSLKTDVVSNPWGRSVYPF